MAARAAIDLAADKLIVLTMPPPNSSSSSSSSSDGSPQLQGATEPLPLWMPLSEAEALLRSMAPTVAQAEQLGGDLQGYSSGSESSGSGSGSGSGSSRNGGTSSSSNSNGSGHAHGSGSSSQQHAQQGQQGQQQLDMDFDRWYDCGLPAPLLAACAVCRSGAVRRAHLVDARMDGGLLLELYSRDGVGCMISTDFYEGIRRAILQVGGRALVGAGGGQCGGAHTGEFVPMYCFIVDASPAPPPFAGPGAAAGAAAAAGGAGGAGEAQRGAAAEVRALVRSRVCLL